MGWLRFYENMPIWWYLLLYGTLIFLVIVLILPFIYK